MAGTDEGLGDSGSGRSGVLSHLQSHCCNYQRRRCGSFNTSTSGYHTSKRSRHQKLVRNPLRERSHLCINAGLFTTSSLESRANKSLLALIQAKSLLSNADSAVTAID